MLKREKQILQIEIAQCTYIESDARSPPTDPNDKKFDNDMNLIDRMI